MKLSCSYGCQCRWLTSFSSRIWHIPQWWVTAKEQFDTAEAAVMTDVSSVCSLDSMKQHHGSRHAISLVKSLQGHVTRGGMCANDTLSMHISAVRNGFVCVIKSSCVQSPWRCDGGSAPCGECVLCSEGVVRMCGHMGKPIPMKTPLNMLPSISASTPRSITILCRSVRWKCFPM